MEISRSPGIMIHFSELNAGLIPSAHRLSTQAGWNQTSDDWERLVRVSPGGVKVWLDDGEVRASYSVIGYGNRVAWIGMILVDEAYRGRGLGKMAFELALKDARAQGFAVLGLDATHMGEPIYSKFGFETTVPIVRWHGELQGRSVTPKEEALLKGWSESLLEFDLLHAGENRSLLLRDLAATATILRLEERGEMVAYAAVRPGRTALQIGPVVANSYENSASIFEHLAIEFSGQPVLCDLLRPEAAGVLAAHGLQPSRSLKRMTIPKQMDCLCGKGIWVGAGFEWG